MAGSLTKVRRAESIARECADPGLAARFQSHRGIAEYCVNFRLNDAWVLVPRTSLVFHTTDTRDVLIAGLVENSQSRASKSGWKKYILASCTHSLVNSREISVRTSLQAVCCLVASGIIKTRDQQDLHRRIASNGSLDRECGEAENP